MFRLRKNLIVDIEFIDHTEGSHTYKFVVSGKISKVTKAAICIDCWRYAEPHREYDENVTRFTICRAAITRIWKHTPELVYTTPKQVFL